MSTIRILIADKDKEYNRSLADYLRSELHPGIEVDTCSEEDFLYKYLADTNENIDIILLDENFTIKPEKMLKTGLVIILTGTRIVFQENTGIICKYQCGEEIANQVMRLFARNNTGKELPCRKSEKSKVISVLSAAGGSGKTAVALGLSIQTAWEGKKVFYLNLENISSAELFLEGIQDKGLSELLYSFKQSKNTNLSAKIEAAKCIDPIYRINYFKRPCSLLDINENLSEEMVAMLEQLSLCRQYDRIFVDLSCGIDLNTLAVLGKSDEILLICTRDGVSELKTRILLDELAVLEKSKNIKILAKIRIVLNRCEESSSDYQNDTAFVGRNICAVIPIEPGLLIRHTDICRLDLNGPFGTTLYKLSRIFDIA